MAPRSRTGCLTCRQRKVLDQFPLRNRHVPYRLTCAHQLKCSEERPVCAQCVKADRECIPSSGITFRHQQNPSLNGDHNDGLKRFYGYKETFSKSTTWVDIPQHLTFVTTDNPYEDDDDCENFGPPPGFHQDVQQRQNDPARMAAGSSSAYATHGLEALSAVASQGPFTSVYRTPPLAPTGHHHERTASSHTSQPPTSPQHHPVPPSQNLDFILNPASTLSPVDSNIDPLLDAQTPTTRPPSQSSPSDHPPHPSLTHVRTASFEFLGGRANSRSKRFPHRRNAIEEPELAFLLRDFAERPGLWMDLFDLGQFFAAKVPVLAVSCPLLLYACASLSAKSLARVAGRKPIMGGQVSPCRQSKMESYPGPPLDQEGWFQKGHKYYDIAVSLLRQALEGGSRPPTSALPGDATPATISTAQGVPLPSTDSDELVAATAILCVYEFLDDSGQEWSRHLDGTKSLFDVAKDRVVPLTLPPSPVSIARQVSQQLAGLSSVSSSDLRPSPSIRGLSQGRRAVFWNFARQDMLAAFIHNTPTRLDTSDLEMWRSAGLKLTVDGYVSASNPESPHYVAEQAMDDDMISNALIWLSMKLVNFIAAGDGVPEDISSPLGLGVRQRELLEYWQSIDEQLLRFHHGVPPGFHATAIHTPDEDEYASEHWFARPMCSSATQWYHFVRIQLLHNKPHLSTGTPHVLGPAAPGTSLASRHASYTTILQQSRAHAKQIVAISLGRGDEGMRIHSVQPLWTAGLVLGNGQDDEDGEVSAETETWRRTIVGLLRGIERDVGWASEYRVQSLLDLWGTLPSHWPS